MSAFRIGGRPWPPGRWTGLGSVLMVPSIGNRLRVETSEGKRALRLVAGGLAFAALCMLLNAWLDVSIGQLHVIAALALVGLLVVVAGGVLGLIAIARHGERSAWVLGAFAGSLLVLLAIFAQFAFGIP